MTKRAFAIVAHPDDIEFQMAGTLILLGRVGFEIHYLNVANGSCGTGELSMDEIISKREKEAKAACASIGAIYHSSLVDDIAIYYEPKLLARISALMRKVAPDILLVQSPRDYMEDHQNTVRLACTAAFTRGMPNFKTDPEQRPIDQPVAIYHAQPHGNRDILRQLIIPEIFVDISEVIEDKTRMLAFHQSQKKWLDQSQGLNAYLDSMREQALEIGKMSGSFTYAEGWRRHLHLGYAKEDFKPLEEALSPYLKVEKSE